jgi:hypothetical protein
MRRTNPRNNGNRNWLCCAKIAEVGVENVRVEIHVTDSLEAGAVLEMELIEKFGRVQLGTGPLTNLRCGGGGLEPMPEAHREKLRVAMQNPNHPIHSKESRARAKKRMNDPDIKVKFLGENNAAKRPEVRAKLKAMWEDPEFRAAQIAVRTGATKNFSAETRVAHAERLKANPEMKGWRERNGIDAEFDAKRIAGIQAAQPKRAEKMRDPVALAQRKERLKATLNSPEYKAKRAMWDTPEYRAKLSENKKAYWATKKRESRCGR